MREEKFSSLNTYVLKDLHYYYLTIIFKGLISPSAFIKYAPEVKSETSACDLFLYTFILCPTELYIAKSSCLLRCKILVVGFGYTRSNI